MVPWNSPHRSPQTTPSISDPTQILPSETIDDPRSRIPPFPLLPPAKTKPPSDNGPDEGKSPSPELTSEELAYMDDNVMYHLKPEGQPLRRRYGK